MDAQALRTLQQRGLIRFDERRLSLAGPALQLKEKLTALFAGLAAEHGAKRRQYSVLLPLSVLERTDYFRSFPHQAMFAQPLDRGAKVAAFAEALRDGEGVAEAATARLAAPELLLSPAVCYHCYAELAGTRLSGPLVLTAVGRCFRHESDVVICQRQREFTMAEIVFVGGSAVVEAERVVLLKQVGDLAAMMGLTTRLVMATDAFYGTPEGRARQVWQQAAALKLELLAPVGDTEIALVSFNLHHDYFGRAFGIELPDGTPASTGCVAFGIERWMAAVVTALGPEPEAWWSALHNITWTPADGEEGS